MVASSQLEGVLVALLEGAVGALGYPMGWIGRFDSSTGRVHPLVQRGCPSDYWSRLRTQFEHPLPRRCPIRRALRLQQPCVLSNTDGNHLSRVWWEDTLCDGYQALAIFPIVLKDGPWGILNVCSDQEDGFQGWQGSLLASLAAQAGAAIENLYLQKRIRRWFKRTQLLQEATQALSSTLDLEAILQTIVEKGSQALGTDHYILTVFPPKNTEPPIVLSKGLSDQLLEAMEELFQTWGRRSRLTHIIQHIGSSRSMPPPLQRLFKSEGIQTLFHLPLRCHGQALGVFTLCFLQKQPFDREDMELAKALSRQASFAIYHAYLFQEAKKQTYRMATLKEIGTAILSSLRLDEVIEKIVHSIRKYLPVDACSVIIWDKTTKKFQVVCSRCRVETPSLTGSYVDISASFLQMFQQRKYLYVSNLHEDHRLQADFRSHLLEKGIHSVLMIPLIIHKELKGFLNLGMSEVDGFSKELITLCEQIAGHLTVAVENALLHEQIRTQLDQQRCLLQVAIDIATGLNIKRTLQKVVQHAVQLVGADAGCMAIREEERHLIRYLYFYNLPHFLTRVVVPEDKGLAGLVMRLKKPLLIEDYASHPAAIPEFVRAGIKAVAGVPILFGKKVLGAFGVFRFEQGHSFTDDELFLLQAVANQAAVALHNAQIYHNLQRQLKHIQSINAIKSLLFSTLDLKDIIQKVSARLRKLFGVDQVCWFYPCTMDTRSVRCLCEAPVFRNYRLRLREQEIPLDNFPSLRALFGIEGPLAAKDVRENPDLFHPEFVRQFGFTSQLSMVLHPRNDHPWMISLQHCSQPYQWTKEEIALFKDICDHVRIALENARLYEESKQRAQEQSKLFAIVSSLNQSLELSEILQTIVQGVTQKLGFKVAYITLYSEAENVLQIRAIHPYWGLVRKVQKTYNLDVEDYVFPVRADQNPLLRKLLNGDIVITHRYSDLVSPQIDPKVADGIQRLAGVQTIADIPLISLGRFLGTLVVGTSESQINRRVICLLETLAQQAAMAIENAQLFQSIREEQERFYQLFEQASDAIFLSDLDTLECLDVNLKACELLGCSKDEIIGKPFDHFLCKGSLEHLGGFLELMQQRGNAYISGLEAKQKGGGRVPVSINASVVKIGQKRFILSFVRDITYRKQMEEKIRRARTLSAVGRMAATIAHEIRNPLGAITNSISVLQRDLKLTGRHAELMEIVLEETERIKGIIDDFLAFARHRKPERVEVNLRALLQETITLLERDESLFKGVTIQLKINHIPLKMHADPDQMRQVFENILINAAQAMPNGGIITIDAECSPVRNRPGVWIHITDEGVGMDETILANLFEPFFTTKEKGSGLGMSIVQRIIEDHEGEIEVTSQRGVGTTVSVGIPL